MFGGSGFVPPALPLGEEEAFVNWQSPTCSRQGFEYEPYCQHPQRAAPLRRSPMVFSTACTTSSS